jgi:hypothetical protein
VNPRDADPLSAWPVENVNEGREVDPRLIAFLDGVIVGLILVLIAAAVVKFIPWWLP